jgi:hypothetical protein
VLCVGWRKNGLTQVNILQIESDPTYRQNRQTAYLFCSDNPTRQIMFLITSIFSTDKLNKESKYEISQGIGCLC